MVLSSDPTIPASVREKLASSRHLHEGVFQAGNSVVELLDPSADALQLLVGVAQLPIGLCKGRALGRHHLRTKQASDAASFELLMMII